MRLSTICEVVLVLTALCATITKCSATNNVASTTSGGGGVRRQTSDPFSQDCLTILRRAACSTSYYQNYINAISKCGDLARDSIQTYEEECQKNADGKFCGEVLSNIDNNCSFSSCSRACNSSLQQAGCCANYSSYSNCLSHGISVPSTCPKSSLTLPILTAEDSCDSEVEYSKTKITAQCNNFHPVLEELSKHETCASTIDYFRSFCSSRNGQYCLVEFNYGSSNFFYSTTIQNSITNCPSPTNCSIACKSSLISVKNTMGCCFHAVNSTGLFLYSVGNPSLWNECGVSVPQRCGAASMKV